MLKCSIALLALALTTSARAGNASQPASDPVLDPPTLQSLGVYWIIGGDDNHNATVKVEFRAASTPSWKLSANLFRVENGKSKLNIPANSSLFAGSIVLLQPNTQYEIRLTLSDPDGGPTGAAAEKTLSAKTISEPIAPAGLKTVQVVPDDPHRDLTAAIKTVKPGTLLLLHAGTYKGPWRLTQSGEQGHPIIFRAAGDGPVILTGESDGDSAKKAFADGSAGDKNNPMKGNLLDVAAQHDLWFEGLEFRNAFNLLKCNDAYRIVVRRCRFSNSICGVVATTNKSGKTGQFFIADNNFDGIFPWPTTHQQWHDLPEARAIWIAGAGNVACYNRIHHWKDAIDTAEAPGTIATDFHNNDISQMFDDGCEMDGSERNTRCFNNRFTDVYQGISFQPIWGGPVYCFRNVIFNVQLEPLKLHNSPSGAVILHNTIVRKGSPLMVMTNAAFSNCLLRNNLFVGTTGTYAFGCDPKTSDCDFDYDGYAGENFGSFLKWNNQKYKSLDDVHKNAPIEKHAIQLDPSTLFAAGVKPPDDENIPAPIPPDLRLSTTSKAVDAGQPLPGFNDGFSGAAPDLGAYEIGAPIPHYGPRQ